MPHEAYHAVRHTLIGYRYGEVADLTAEMSILHITDLATLDRLLKGYDGSSTGGFSTDNVLAGSFAGVRGLSLAFRLPLQVYQMIELQERQPVVPNHANDQSRPAAWKGIWSAIAKLKHLCSLEISLDHDSEASWTLVNEAAILSPLLPLSHNSTISTTICLPSIPPQDTQQDTGSSARHILSMFNTRRFMRQRFFPEQRRDGTYGIIYEDDANNIFHDSGPSADELARTAEITMHVWLHGIGLDYLAMSEEFGGC
ncbi:hypothetical protein ED733_005254 [Metarhizium rileyi]|uniref:Uncharacterized protein n=1 Tax=Metarhizium rileyi (strain RCEF 4871) TaxID=1649241 RepID=A0A5C6G967_METRR|nr:hypothetical protein ED733_005254 [Metarhizium rileyi]